jgi:acylphosphatase
MSNTELASVHAIVYGYVQGVFFRAFVSRRANELGLTGYVRNLPDGAVEVQAEGERKQLEKLISHLRVGPPAAIVERVVTNWSEYTGTYSTFSIRHSWD